jgi:hypothetical protein
MKATRRKRQALEASAAGARTRLDLVAASMRQMAADLADARKAAEHARGFTTAHTRHFASSADFDREAARAKSAAAGLARAKDETRRQHGRSERGKDALAAMAAESHSKLVEHLRRERAMGAVKDEVAAISRELAAARRRLRGDGGGDGGDGSRLVERLGGSGDPQWRQVQEAEEERRLETARLDEARRELRVAEARAAARRGEAAASDAARLVAAERSAVLAEVEARDAAGEEAAAAAGGLLAEAAEELAGVEAEVRAVGADLRYLAAWHAKHAPCLTLWTSPVVVVDIAPDPGPG